MQFCFIRDSTVLIMPVTPEAYRWKVGKNMETIRISAIGDVYRPSGRTRFHGEFTFLLPAQTYPWMEAGSRADPAYYLDQLNAWAKDVKPLRFLISGTQVNCLCYIESVEQAERDGTGDIYATVTVREYVELGAKEMVSSTRTTIGPSSIQQYTIKSGDTLSMICRRFYGDGSLYPALATYNGIPNPDRIYTGRTIQVPPKSNLEGGSA